MTSVERLPQIPIQIITSVFTKEDLPQNSNCEECSRPMTPAEVSWTGNNSYRARVIVKAEKVPALHCEGECGGSWFKPEVVLDLLSQSVPILTRYGDYEVAEHFERSILVLKKQIAVRNSSAGE